ncbi:hypothetical protein [Paenibacillus graminis]|uniref:hypothetical protein n=1 Tax=Paenibacillus graminis TaxID=189425 RepID=UPI002DB749C3|nr:hypothetical protein [Paenibacillus graminis]MEC0167353.1 hypothetical protein [Paenibacillus graminis]
MTIEAPRMFTTEDMRKLEQFFLTPHEIEDLAIGNLVTSEDVADTLETFNMAHLEGDYSICYVGYEEQDNLVKTFERLCQLLNVRHKIYIKGNEVVLDLHPED